ncbi:MAG: hypothetical protein ACRDV2_01300, partial [Actinomycetes bacterium]
HLDWSAARVPAAPPLGAITPVATSATLGGGADGGPALREFAETVFGAEFDETSLIGEDRLTAEEWATAPQGQTPLLDEVTAERRAGGRMARLARSRQPAPVSWNLVGSRLTPTRRPARLQLRRPPPACCRVVGWTSPMSPTVSCVRWSWPWPGTSCRYRKPVTRSTTVST